MKVLLINASPHEKGSTDAALREVAAELERVGVEAEVFHAGKRPVRDCVACLACRKNPEKLCAFSDDVVNELIRKAREADGLVFGSPVYYAGPSGLLCSLMDRMFYATGGFPGKPAASVAVCRRTGGSAALDRINKYFTICQMPVVSADYWNVVHGNNAAEVAQDLEGMQTMRTLARNMAGMLTSLARGREAGVPQPEMGKRIRTNFIR